jgi:hypothetical protein
MMTFTKKLLFILTFFYSAHSFSINGLDISATAFRKDIASFIHAKEFKHTRQLANIQNHITKRWDTSIQDHHWHISLDAIQSNFPITHVERTGDRLVPLLNHLIESVFLKIRQSNITSKDMSFIVKFYYYPNGIFQFIVRPDSTFEMIGNRVTQRQLNTTTIAQFIQSGEQYLNTRLNKSFYGMPKFYNAENNTAETHLRTIYTASTLYTFLKLQDAHLGHFDSFVTPMANFLLRQQIKGGKQEGSFYYSFNPITQKHDQLTVVGTTSKTIFTLIKLYELTHNDVYLSAAKKAGYWLLKRILPNGKIISSSSYHHQQWKDNLKQSHLYKGQVLSALSRLYLLTHENAFLKAASLLKTTFIEDIHDKGLPVSDDYRTNTPIGTSWVMMSFIDYARATNDPITMKYIEDIANYLSNTHINGNQSIYHLGRYAETTTPSGNGWINEVFGEYYLYCLQKNLGHCDRFLPDMLSTTRWLLQNNISKPNLLMIKSYQDAKGGAINLFNSYKVRTDAVCHGVNSLIILKEMTKSLPSPLYTLSEPPFENVLSSLRAGDKAYPPNM